MTRRDIVVIGASAGGIQALSALVGGLPADFAAAVLVVVHVPPYAVSRLPAILSRVGPLPAAPARQGEPIEAGRIYVAPPDRHVLVRQGWIELTRGPRENHSRPAIDPLFRTAARAYGARVVGVVLSGALYDGSMGLLAIKTRGGTAVVQDPQEAAFASMPLSALQVVAADHVLPAAAMAPILCRLTGEAASDKGDSGMADEEERLETAIAQDFAEQAGDDRAEETTVFTCPDCGGVLWQGGEGATLRFRCHVGHAYGPELLLDQKAEELEAALWKSLRLLREKATLTRQMATRSREDGNGRAGPGMTERIEDQAELDERYARAIQELLEAMPSPMDQAAVVGQTVDDGGRRRPHEA